MKARILLVEDNADWREIVGRYLRNRRYQLSEAMTGQQALERAKTARPDLMILDLGLPDMSGLEVLALLQQDATTSVIPVIVQTAWLTDNIKTKALQAGAASFLVKPTAPVVLNDTIQMILDAVAASSHMRAAARPQFDRSVSP